MTSTEPTNAGLPPVDGLVLMGGLSTRMGTDKSELAYHGQPQRDYLTALLQPFCRQVYWSVNAEQAATLPPGGPPRLIDVVSERPGPLNGMLSAVAHDPTCAWLVVACDMPLLSARSFDALLAGRRSETIATAFYDTDGRYPEPLLCLWEPGSGPVLQAAFASGMVSPRKILMMNAVTLLPPPDPRELTNINSPDERSQLGF